MYFESRRYTSNQSASIRIHSRHKEQAPCDLTYNKALWEAGLYGGDRLPLARQEATRLYLFSPVKGPRARSLR